MRFFHNGNTNEALVINGVGDYFNPINQYMKGVKLVYSYKNDPLYPSVELTVSEIEIAHSRAKKLRAEAFLSAFGKLVPNKHVSDKKSKSRRLLSLFAQHAG